MINRISMFFTICWENSHCKKKYDPSDSSYLRIHAMRALDNFMIMANTENSFMIREYFLDLKRIMTEYNIYQMVYRSKYELCTKDSAIDKLCNDMHTLIEKSDYQTKQLEVQSQQ